MHKRVNTNGALETRPGPGWHHLTGFFLAGVAAASLVAAGLRWLPESPGGDDAESTAVPRDVPPRPPEVNGMGDRAEAPRERSQQELLADIMRVLAGPHHSLTMLRLRALLESIPAGQIPDLMRLASEELDARTCASWFEPLLNRWAAEDPDATLDFVLSDRIGSQVDPIRGTNLVDNIFSSWMRRDAAAARSWLLDRWHHQVLGESAFLGSLRQFLAINMVDHMLRSDGVDAAFAFANELPGRSDRHAVLTGLTDSPWHPTMQRASPGDRMEIYQAVKALDDGMIRLELARGLWLAWSEHHPDWVQEIAPELPPDDRFALALAWMGTVNHWSEMVPNGDGSFTQTNLGVSDREAREAAALQAGLAAGHSRSETLEAMFKVIVDRLDGSLEWIDRQGNVFDADPILVRQARDHVASSSWSGDELPPMAAIQWASRISDPVLREQMCRGAYLRLIHRDPAAARAYLERANAPQDLLPVFQSILATSP